MIPRFRAWLGKDSQFCTEFGYKSQMVEVLSIDFEDESITAMVDCSCLIKGRLRYKIFFKDIVLMQSTGLKDKCNDDIFPGDILLFSTGAKAYVVKDIATAKYVLYDLKNETYQGELAYSSKRRMVVDNMYRYQELFGEN